MSPDRIAQVITLITSLITFLTLLVNTLKTYQSVRQAEQTTKTVLRTHDVANAQRATMKTQLDSIEEGVIAIANGSLSSANHLDSKPAG